jgi:hypothetical protein
MPLAFDPFFEYLQATISLIGTSQCQLRCFLKLNLFFWTHQTKEEPDTLISSKETFYKYPAMVICYSIQHLSIFR